MITSTTFHYLDRAKERCNQKSTKKALQSAEHAMLRGQRADILTSLEKNYLSNKAYGNCIAIAYNNMCYIFTQDNVCITVYELPSWFGKKKHFNGKERIRDYKKYCKSNSHYFEAEIYN